MKTIRRFLADESGATAIEYGLIAANFARDHCRERARHKLNNKFTAINTSLK